jgi:hypothetical protein
VSAVSWPSSPLRLKLTRTRAICVDDLPTDPAAVVLSRLTVPPKKSALIDYFYRLSHDHRLRLLVVLDGRRRGNLHQGNLRRNHHTRSNPHTGRPPPRRLDGRTRVINWRTGLAPRQQ